MGWRAEAKSTGEMERINGKERDEGDEMRDEVWCGEIWRGGKRERERG